MNSVLSSKANTNIRRQALTAYVIMTVSVLIFATSATFLSLIFAEEAAVVAAALIAATIGLYMQVKLLSKFAVAAPIRRQEVVEGGKELYSSSSVAAEHQREQQEVIPFPTSESFRDESSSGWLPYYSTHVVPLGPAAQLVIEGLPVARLATIQVEQLVLALIQHGLPSISAAPRNNDALMSTTANKSAVLTLAGEYHKLKYRLQVPRAVAAAEVYSEAIQYLERQKGEGLDAVLVEEAVQHLREQFRREFG